MSVGAVSEERRPPARTTVANLRLAGDWTDTGLPATIEGAIRSGVTAANMILNPPRQEKSRRKNRATIDHARAG